MYSARAEHSNKIAIKSAKALVPGYGTSGIPFGRLVPSSDILSGIRPRRAARPGRGDPHHAKPAEDLPGSWLKTLLGFESIATTHATQSAVEEAIASGLEWSRASAELRKPPANDDLEAMTTQVIDSALGEYENQRNRSCARARSILGHIHLASTASVRTPYALLESRRAAGCDKAGLPIMSLLSGCSGLLFALQQARFLLKDEEGAGDEDAFVLISCSNDLLPFAHTRGRSPVGHSEDIDAWLFQAIFGEGAGAIVVGRAHPEGGDWVIEDMGRETVADDWRVTMVSEEGAPSMVIRAREVGMTFRTHVPRAAKRGLDALGLGAFGGLHRLCVHESNPNLVAHVASTLGASDVVHSISAEVGTLAAVSAFSLLEEALRSHGSHGEGGSGARDAIVCALIGETGNSVVAGHVALRFARA
jgi:hypothetical protein